MNATILFHKEPLVVSTIHNSEGGTSMRQESHNEELSGLAANFINDVRILVGQVEFIVAFLASLRFDAQLTLVHIVEEQDCTKQSGFTHTLCTYEMYVAIELNLSVWHMGTIDKYDFIEVSHLLRLRLC